MAKQSRKVVRFRRFRLQPGVVILFLTVIYVIIYLIMFLSKEQVSVYEVTYGSTVESVNTSYTGFALRDETVYYAEHSGYVNFYVREGSRVSRLSTLYSIDESGTVASLLQSMSQDGNTLSSEDLSSVKETIHRFCINFDTSDFSALYDFKYSLDSQLLEAVTTNMLDKVNESIDKDSFSVVTAPETGIVSYYIDNLESLQSPEQLTADLFNTGTYARTNLSSNDLVAAETPLYKIIGSEQWQIVIPLTDAEADAYAERTRMEITFKEDGITTTGGFSVIKNADGYYGVISLNKYMIRYLSERFIDIRLSVDSDEGLKIPKSAVFDESFYLVPTSYYCQGGDNSDTYGFNLEVFADDGTATLRFITPTIYYSTDEYCYISKSAVNNGDILVRPDSNERYQINTTGTLQGVYQINSGYTAFKRIEVLSETNEYYIVSDETSNGLILYDHILLRKGNFEENDIIY